MSLMNDHMRMLLYHIDDKFWEPKYLYVAKFKSGQFFRNRKIIIRIGQIAIIILF